MTTVAWDGKTLAVDRLSTRTLTNPIYCQDCDSESNTQYRLVKKLAVNKNPSKHIFGDKPIVLGFAGCSETCRILSALIVTGASEETIRAVMKPSPLLRSVSMLAVTDGKGYKITFDDSAFGYKEVTAPYAIGSGATAAKFAMGVLGMDAPSAIAASIEADDYTGGGVAYIDLNDQGLEFRDVEYVPGSLVVSTKYKSVMTTPQPKTRRKRTVKNKTV